MLCLEHVDYRYARDSPVVLHDTSLVFRHGITALLGRNGAGKSTVLSLLATSLMADGGCVSVDGLRATRRTLTEYRKRVAWMPQRIVPMRGFTVLESVVYAGWLGGLSTHEAEERTGSALSRVSLSDRSGDKASTLSGGQLRRLGIAQCLVRDVPWLLLDEPFAGLDPIERLSLERVLKSLSGTVDMVVSTHQTHDVVDVFDYVTVIDHGDSIWQGAPQEFFELGRSVQGMGNDPGAAAFASLVSRS